MTYESEREKVPRDGGRTPCGTLWTGHTRWCGCSGGSWPRRKKTPLRRAPPSRLFSQALHSDQNPRSVRCPGGFRGHAEDPEQRLGFKNTGFSIENSLIL